MRRTLDPIAKSFAKAGVAFEFFQGDSFQAVVPVEEALRIALMIRASMRADDQALDVRVAIGIGSISYRAKTLSHSGGDAFEHSGLMLAGLKKTSGRLGIVTPNADWNKGLYTECVLAESSLRRWTPGGAQAVYLALLTGETQEVLAKRLKIAQPSVARRLLTADWPALRYWERDYRRQLHHYLPNA